MSDVLHFHSLRDRSAPETASRQPAAAGRPPAGRRAVHLAVNQEGFAFDPRTGDSYLVNPVGLAILNGLQQGATTDAIAAQIVERFEVAEATARADLADFLAQLQNLQLA